MPKSYLLAVGLFVTLPQVASAQDPLAPPPPPDLPVRPVGAPAPLATPAPFPLAAPAPAVPNPNPMSGALYPGDAGSATMTPTWTASPEPPTATVTSTVPVITVEDAPLPPGSEAMPSLGGSVGLFRMSSANLGAPGQLRIGLHTQYFNADDFLIKDDQNLRLQGALSFGFTPLRYIEVFGSLLGSANRNKRVCDVTGMCTSEPGRTDPDVIKAYGDLVVGSKLAYPLAPGMSAGGELGLKFMSSISGLSFKPGATSVWMSGLGTWDMAATSHVPLRFLFNLGLYLDNSSELHDFRSVTRPTKAVSQFAYGIAKDRVRTALGLEWTFHDVSPGLAIRPFGEYHLEFVVADADPTFNDFRAPLCKGSSPTASPNAFECRDNRDQHWMTLGISAQVNRAFTVAAGLDLSVRSVGFPYGSPLPPYNIILGVAYPLDLGRSKVITKTITVDKGGLSNEGSINGKVLSITANAPIEGAIIGVAGRMRARVATDPDGAFRTADHPAGPIELEVSAPDFEAASVRTMIVPGQSSELVVTLTPKVKKSQVSGRLVDEAGRPVAAVLRFSGAQNAEVRSDDSGSFLANLVSGSYTVRIESESHLAKEIKVVIDEGQEARLSTAVRVRPAIARVSVRGSKILVRQPISFRVVKGASPDLVPAAQALLDEVVDVLISRPEIKRVRIEAHWDSSLPKDRALQVTNDQARVVANYLAKQGVADDRIEAVGLGGSRPLIPNIGTAAKARNRRIEFHVVN